MNKNKSGFVLRGKGLDPVECNKAFVPDENKSRLLSLKEKKKRRTT